jgi:hypothetical protein
MSLLSNFLPDPLPEIFSKAPKIIFKSFPVTQLLKEATTLTSQMMNHDIQNEMKESLREKIPSISIEIAPSIEVPIKKLNHEQAVTLLKLYFFQLKHHHQIFLDLRSVNFGQKNGFLTWAPTALYHSFQTEFHQGILNLYFGFFTGNDEAMDQGLKQIKLIQPEMSELKKTELRSLFKSHFGNAMEGEVILNLNDFNKSFNNILQFLDQENLKIEIDFLYFGIYLITLYLSLDPVASPIPVKKIYEEIFLHF